ncbi:MAG: MFS transporter, partial [Burkholderiaceae bacterium]|nr:MFS transporter [Burkholderiaceae bacterium]
MSEQLLQQKKIEKSPWLWVPSLYFGQGIPYVVVMTLSVIMYKNNAISNTDIALYTSWLYLPWVIKPLWSPFIDMYRSKRFWIVGLQLVIGAALALVALTTALPNFFQISLAIFWLMAFSSATHDIAADGYYMLSTEPHQQAAFVGVRSTCFRLAMIAGQGGLVFIAGYLEQATGKVPLAWALVFGLLGLVFLALCAYHQWVLPRPASDALRAPHGDA